MLIIGRFEIELATIHQRLDHLTNLLSSGSSHSCPHAGHGSVDSGEIIEQSSDNEHTPCKLLNRRRMMGVLGLGEDIADELVKMERKPSPVGNVGISRLYVVQHHEAAK